MLSIVLNSYVWQTYQVIYSRKHLFVLSNHISMNGWIWNTKLIKVSLNVTVFSVRLLSCFPLWLLTLARYYQPGRSCRHLRLDISRISALRKILPKISLCFYPVLFLKLRQTPPRQTCLLNVGHMLGFHWRRNDWEEKFVKRSYCFFGESFFLT